jgi:hypothetical protein
LKPCKGTAWIEAVFRNVSSEDEKWGYNIKLRLGRLDYESGPFELAVQYATAMEDIDGEFVGSAWTTLVSDSSAVVLPKPNVIYTMRFTPRVGQSDLPTNVHVRIEARGRVAGLVCFHKTNYFNFSSCAG